MPPCVEMAENIGLLIRTRKSVAGSTPAGGTILVKGIIE
jgi:hypothetical protein